MASTTPIFINNVAYQLKLFRVNRGWSLATAGDKGQMEPSAVSRIESGVHEGNINGFVDLIEGYGIPLEQVMKHYDALPTKEEWKEVNKRAQDLGAELRTKKKNKKKNKELLIGRMGKQLSLWEEAVGEKRKEGKVPGKRK
jgi:transcriptional regulator with XRE-family HTH domain